VAGRNCGIGTSPHNAVRKLSAGGTHDNTHSREALVHQDRHNQVILLVRQRGNQAFRYEAQVYAFQFHLEVDEPMILRWLKVPENRREIQSLHGDIDPDQIHRETVYYIDRLHELSDHVFGQFIALFGADKSRRRLLSR
jgi:hypothetical protein